jgi:hypothetical protein
MTRTKMTSGLCLTIKEMLLHSWTSLGHLNITLHLHIKFNLLTIISFVSPWRIVATYLVFDKESLYKKYITLLKQNRKANSKYVYLSIAMKEKEKNDIIILQYFGLTSQPFSSK